MPEREGRYRDNDDGQFVSDEEGAADKEGTTFSTWPDEPTEFWLVSEAGDPEFGFTAVGVATSEEEAIKMCTSDRHYIGPVPVNKPIVWSEWDERVYYPHPPKDKEAE